MARETGERWDLVLDGLGLMIDRPVAGRRIGKARAGFTTQTTDIDQRSVQQDVPVEQSSFSAGACYSQTVPGVEGYAYSDGATAAWGAVTPIGEIRSFAIPTDTNHVRNAFEWRGKLYVVGATKVIRMPLGGGAAETLLDVRTPPTSAASASNEIGLATIYKDHLIVGGGPSTLGLMQYDGSNWLQAGGSPLVQREYAASQFWRIDGIGAHRLLGSIGTTTFAHTNAAPATTTTNGIFSDAAWSIQLGNTTAKMADDGYLVSGLVVAESSVLWLTEGGAMEVNQYGDVANRTSYWKSFRSALGKVTSGLMVGDWALLPHSNGLDRINVKTKIANGPTGWCQPGVGLENATPIYGKPEALEYYAGGAFAFFYNGADSWLMYGLDRAEAGVTGVGPLVWHSFKKFEGVRGSGLKAVTDPLTGRRYLWIFAKNEVAQTMHCWRMDLPTSGFGIQDLLYGNTGMQWGTGGSFYLTRQTWGRPTLYKALRRFEITGRRFGAPQVALFANADEGGWVYQGRTSTRGGGTFLARTRRAKQLEMRLDLTGGSASDPPIVDAIRATGRYAPKRSDARTYQIRLGAIDRHGNADNRDQVLVWRKLRNYVEQTGGLNLVDEIGDPLVVDVVDVRAVGSEQSSDYWQRLIEVTLVELRSRTYYNSGAAYNQGATYG